MRLLPTEVAGAFLVEADRASDVRGAFVKTFDATRFAEAGVATSFAEVALAENARRGTLRGLHRQLPPKAEAKLVHCVRGAIFDVVADVRPESATYLRWHGAELTSENRLGLYAPPGCLHGYVTLEDASDVAYLLTEPFAPELAVGVRWDDPTLAIAWPLEPVVVSERDAALPHLGA